MPPKQLEAKIKEIDDDLDALKAELVLCYQIKQAKIPPYEKLPQDHVYYKHYM